MATWLGHEEHFRRECIFKEEEWNQVAGISNMLEINLVEPFGAKFPNKKFLQLMRAVVTPTQMV